jgi:hypothetical protein
MEPARVVLVHHEGRPGRGQRQGLRGRLGRDREIALGHVLSKPTGGGGAGVVGGGCSMSGAARRHASLS